MLWETRHAFQHQRELDNRLLQSRGEWPAQQHATRTREALEWATLGGAKALGLGDRIGSITPGKQADLVMIETAGMNVFPSVQGGDPVHAAVMYAETADIDSVMVAGRFVKRHGKLLYPESRRAELLGRLLESRERIMDAGAYRYAPAAGVRSSW
jgi:cytosine/adenosine deaminase-related metal-dependent hydrolase